jgi:hypothetical protein
MERTLIAWNVPNTLTVVLMAALGWFAFSLATQLVLGQFSRPTAAAGE